MILEIFKAAVHSVGTATTMTAAGVYLHRRGFIDNPTKTGMARYTQQIAIPALFFSKIVDCPQNYSTETCPNILDHLSDAWILLVWPVYVLAIGLLVGWLVVQWTKPPQYQVRCILAASAFANAMGMPITLLNVIGMNFPTTSGLDASMFQSIYVILNPVLQWGLGGWLLQNEDDDQEDDYNDFSSYSSSSEEPFYIDVDVGDHDEDEQKDQQNEPHNCKKSKKQKKNQRQHRHTFPALRRANYSIPSLEDLGYNSSQENEQHRHPSTTTTNNSKLKRNLYSIPSLEEYGTNELPPPSSQPPKDDEEKMGLLITMNSPDLSLASTATTYYYGSCFGSARTDTQSQSNKSNGNIKTKLLVTSKKPPLSQRSGASATSFSSNKDKNNNSNTSEWMLVLKKIASKAFQPPAVGAMMGFVVASYAPLRGLFVDMQHRADNAPLEWIFDGLLMLAQSAIPVNMCVVGVNLSIASSSNSSSNTEEDKEKRNSSGNGTPNSNTAVTPKTIAAVVIGKLLLMPLMGVTTVYILKTYFWNVPEDIQFQFYLVLGINFITPTANVVMVIAELGSGEKAKNVMASLIGWQYVVAPFLLSLTVMVVVWTAVL